MKNNKNEVQIFGVIMDIQPGTFSRTEKNSEDSILVQSVPAGT